MAWSINPEYKEIKQNPINPYHDLRTTTETIKQLLADGTPDWFSHPEDYKNFADESYQYDLETSKGMVLEYRMEDQDQLIDFKARNVNLMGSKDFVLRLRENGVHCIAHYNGMPGTAGLWAIVPTKHGSDVRFITSIQIPAMIEWSVLRLDAHGLPNGCDYIGWRTAVSMLIRKGVLTEERAHEIFGRPTDSIVSRRYRRTLYAHRHRRQNTEVRDGF